MEDQERRQAEALSQALEELDKGVYMPAADKVVQDCLELAVLLKEEYAQEPLPYERIGLMSDILAGELQGQRRARQQALWYKSGAGLIAAVVIAAFVTLFSPYFGEPKVAEQEVFPKETPQLVATAPNTVDRVPVPREEDVLPQGSHSLSTEAATAQEEKVALKNEKPDAALVEKELQVASAATESQPMLLARQNLRMTKVGQSLAETAIGEMTTVYSLPEGQFVAVRTESYPGEIRQIYQLANKKQVIITQQVLENVKNQQPVSDQGKASTAQEAAAGKLQRIVVEKGQLRITLEGEGSTGELEKIAAQLVAKKVEP